MLKKEVDPTKLLIKRVEKENSQLTNQISELMEKNQELIKKVKTIEYHLDSYKNDSEHYNRKINELKSQNSSKDKIIDELEVDNYQLRQAIRDISVTRDLGKRNIHHSNYDKYTDTNSTNKLKNPKKDNYDLTEKITDIKKSNNIENIEVNSSGDIAAFIQEYNKKISSDNINNEKIIRNKKIAKNDEDYSPKANQIKNSDFYDVYNSKKTRTRKDDFNGMIGILSYTDENINKPNKEKITGK